MKQHITIKQIAEESGCSIATVSRVLNGTVPVKEEKRRKIEKVIKKYNFAPNALARGLVSRQSMTIGVIIPDITNPYFAASFAEIERFAIEAGYSVFLCNTMYGNGSQLKEEAYFQMMIDKQVDGVLIMGGQIDMEKISKEYQKALANLSAKIPVIVIGESIENIDCLFIRRENGSGVLSAMNYLYSMGHRRIAFVGGQAGVKITNIRLEAYQKALRNNGLSLDKSLISLSDYYAKDGYLAMQNLWKRGADFTAILVMNDMVALGAKRAIYEKGLTIPNDIAMISCDQFPEAEYQVPSLTGINRHNEVWGRMVISALISLIKGNTELIEFDIPPQLMIRESCGSRLGIRNFMEKQ